MIVDLEALHRSHVSGWGDRMTIGIEVGILRQLLDELVQRRLEVDALSRNLREAQDRAERAEDALTQLAEPFVRD